MSVIRFLSIAIVVFGLFAFAHAAPAQISIYGTAGANAFGFTGDNYPSGPSLKPRTTGFSAGAFYMFPSLSRLKLGLDSRFTSSPAYNGGRAYTGGIRVSFVPRHFILRPYGQFGGGVASTQLHESICNVSGCSQTTNQITSGVVQLNAGVDIHVARHFDIRAFDYQTDMGGSRGLTSAAVRSFSAGVVYHIPSR